MNHIDGRNSSEITSETLKNLLDYSSDEIFIFNKDQKIVYVNSACERNYGLTKEDLLGKHSNELFAKKYWAPSVYPEVFQSKKQVSMIQTTNTGAELLTTAIPVLGSKSEIELVITTARELENYKLNTQSEQTSPQNIQNIVTESPNFKGILAFSEKVAKSNSTVLIQGESGTGKGILANYIHQASNRKNEAFLTINCAAIPEDLLASELFGYEKGAFTGANPAGKIGLLESANNGIVFLDEIGDISLGFQVKILQVIQDKEFIPVGGSVKKKVNVRFIAATNRDLEKLVQTEKFREDLYYRLNVIDITIPSLRKRKEDIIPMLHHFLEKYNVEYETNKQFTQNCLQFLREYDWPGNVRQLENLVERLVIISDSIIDITDLPETFHVHIKNEWDLASPKTLDDALDHTRRYMIRKSFKKFNSTRKVAQDLNVSQTTASRLIREYCNDLRQNK